MSICIILFSCKDSSVGGSSGGSGDGGSSGKDAVTVLDRAALIVEITKTFNGDISKWDASSVHPSSITIDNQYNILYHVP